MSDSASGRFDRWNARAGLAAVLALVCAVLVPDGRLWTAPAAAALVGLILATMVVLGRRAMLLLIRATAETEA